MYDLIMNSRAGYILQVVPFILLAGGVYLLLRRRYLRQHRLPWHSGANEFFRWLTVCYFAGLFALVWTPSNLWSSLWYTLLTGQPGDGFGPMFQVNINLVPTFLRRLTGEYTSGGWVRFMELGNVLMFLPFGFLLPFVRKQANLGRVVLAGAALSAVIEVGQIVVARSTDIDDLIANTLGALAGYGLFALVRLALPRVVEDIQNG